MTTAQVLNTVCDYLDDHVMFPSGRERLIVALWIMHTHVLDAFDTTPYLWIHAVFGAGKSDLGRAIRQLALKAHLAYGPTLAAQRRFLEPVDGVPGGACTLVIDEFDHLLESIDRGGMWAILNGGYKRDAETLNAAEIGAGIERRGLFYPRAFISVQVAGFPSAFVSRTVPVTLHPHTLDEEEELDSRKAESAFSALAMQEMLLAWTADPELIARLRSNATDPKLVKRLRSEDPLRGRDAEVWGPLLAIAFDATPEDGERARAIAVHTSSADDRTDQCPADVVDELLIEAMAEVNRHGRHSLLVGNWSDPKSLPVPKAATEAGAALSNLDLGYFQEHGPMPKGRKPDVYLNIVDLDKRRAELRIDSRRVEQIMRRLGSDRSTETNPQRRRGAWNRDSALRAFDDAGRLSRNGRHRTQAVPLYSGDPKRRCVVLDWSHILWPSESGS